MKGVYKYLDKDGRVQITRDTDNIPEDATSLITFYHPPIPAPPHTEHDHEFIASIRKEFKEVFKRIYGEYPPEKGVLFNAANQQTG